jgi:spore coat assembly protein
MTGRREVRGVALNVGDVVACKSTNRDIFFKIQEFVTTDSGETRARLRGLDVRLYADSPVEDLVKVEGDRLREYRKRFIRQNNECLRKILARRTGEQRLTIMRAKNKYPGDFFEIPGWVLHIDGNLDYLKLCLGIYEQLGITAEGLFVPEEKQPASVPELIRKLRPDILVLTGHDGMVKSTEAFNDLSNYYNSKYFVAGVEAAREVECDKDNLVIFAGACQSHYEALISAGANYASSPMRVLIHAFDPVFIVEKIAFTHISQTVSINEVIANTIAGLGSLGGIETRGIYRKGFPKSPY